jgi:hypothetical protein
MKRMSGTRPKRRNDRAAKSPWPFVVIAVGAVFIVVGFLAWRGSRPPQTTPSPGSTGGARLSVDRATIDFGKVPLDVPVKATFKLQNVGDQPLTLKGEPRVELVQGC